MALCRSFWRCAPITSELRSFANTRIAQVSEPVDQAFPGFLTLTPKSTSTVTVTFSLPIRLLSPHPATNQDTLTVSRGPIIYTAESFDNDSLDSSYPHFTGIGMSESTTFTEHTMEIEGIPMIGLASKEKVYALNEVGSKEPYRVVGGGSGVKGRSWKMLEEGLVLVPWFARANRGGKGRVRTAFIRVGEKEE